MAIPNAQVALLQPDGTLTLPWRLFMQGLGSSSGTVTPAEIAALEAAIAIAAAEAAAASSQASAALAEAMATLSVAQGALALASVGIGDDPEAINIATGTGLTGGPITSTGTISIAPTAVTAGSYTNTNLTVNAEGQITVAANGSGGGGAIVLISEVVTSSSQTSVTFSTISGSYRDLIVKFRGRSLYAAGAFDEVCIQINGDTGNNYLDQTIQANSTTLSAAQQGPRGFIDVGKITSATASSGYAGAGELTIYNYVGTSFFKELIGKNFSHNDISVGLVVEDIGGTWTSMLAVNAVEVFLFSGLGFVDNTVISLYGSL